jgi:hypothetical protein
MSAPMNNVKSLENSARGCTVLGYCLLMKEDDGIKDVALLKYSRTGKACGKISIS